MIDFGIDFLAILATFWGPCWGYIGTVFNQNGGGRWSPALVFVTIFVLPLFRRLDRIVAPFWLHYGTPGRHLASMLEVFLACWLHFGAKLALS